MITLTGEEVGEILKNEESNVNSKFILEQYGKTRLVQELESNPNFGSVSIIKIEQ